VGESLLKTFRGKMRRQKVVQISLRVGKLNHEGIRFYKKFGFRERKGFLIMDQKG